MKYVVVLVVALWATRLVLSRSQKRNDTSGAGNRLRHALESTVRKAALAMSALLAALVVILVVQHLTS